MAKIHVYTMHIKFRYDRPPEFLSIFVPVASENKTFDVRCREAATSYKIPCLRETKVTNLVKKKISSGWKLEASYVLY